MEKDREEFEKWNARRSMNPNINARDSQGDYLNIDARRRWEVWQAAISTRQPEIDALKAEIERLEKYTEWVRHLESSGIASLESFAKSAPTPPAPENVVNECTSNPVVAHETGNVNDKQEDELRYEESEREWSLNLDDSAPPAQDDEPVAYYGARCHGYFQDVLLRTTDDLGSYREAGFTLIPLYTRPAPSNSVIRENLITVPAQEDEVNDKQTREVGILYVSLFRGHLENTHFDYYGDLPEGSHELYTRPDNSELRKAAEEALKLLDKLGSGPTIENLRAALEGK